MQHTLPKQPGKGGRKIKSQTLHQTKVLTCIWLEVSHRKYPFNPTQAPKDAKEAVKDRRDGKNHQMAMAEGQ